MQNKNKIQYEMENVELKKVCIKYCTCYYFNDTIEIEDFSLDNI